jgi:hypothetical protein
MPSELTLSRLLATNINFQLLTPRGCFVCLIVNILQYLFLNQILHQWNSHHRKRYLLSPVYSDCSSIIVMSVCLQTCPQNFKELVFQTFRVVMADTFYSDNLKAKDICYISYSCKFVPFSLSSLTITAEWT